MLETRVSVQRARAERRLDALRGSLGADAFHDPVLRPSALLEGDDRPTTFPLSWHLSSAEREANDRALADLPELRGLPGRARLVPGAVRASAIHLESTTSTSSYSPARSSSITSRLA